MHRTITLLAICAALAAVAPAQAATPAPADAIDLGRYAGTWHEIARLPNFFQRKCAGDVRATYTLAGEYVRVVNRCRRADGSEIVAEGRARVIDAPLNRRLKVGFVEILGWWPFEGDYWILAIDPDYRWVIVGGPDHKYGWVLARTPQLDPATRAQIDRRLEGLGYDPARFIGARPGPGAPP